MQQHNPNLKYKTQYYLTLKQDDIINWDNIPYVYHHILTDLRTLFTPINCRVDLDVVLPSKDLTLEELKCQQQDTLSFVIIIKTPDEGTDEEKEELCESLTDRFKQMFDKMFVCCSTDKNTITPTPTPSPTCEGKEKEQYINNLVNYAEALINYK